MKRTIVVLCAGIGFVAACAETSRLVAPSNVPEGVAYTEAGAQAAIKTLADLTCKQYMASGTCVDAGRPLHPARSQGYLETLSKVRQAARAAGTMSASGGQCLGQPSTPQACLALAQTMLAEVDRALKSVK